MPEIGSVGLLTYGVAMRALPSEEEMGDSYLVTEIEDGVLIAVVDGLGHGAQAAHAARLAVEMIHRSKRLDVVTILQDCDRVLRESRGAVITIATIKRTTNLMTWVGVGDVQGMIARTSRRSFAPPKEFVVLRGGVVGHRMPTLRHSMRELVRGDTIVFATDGINRDFVLDNHYEDTPEKLARRILDRYANDNDDCLVLAARYQGDTNRGPHG